MPARLLGLLCLHLCLYAPYARAQQGGETASPGQWASYLSHTNGVQVVAQGNVFWSISTTTLAYLDPARQKYKAYTALDGMHGNDPTALAYDAQNNVVLVGFRSGMIDLVAAPGSFEAIPDIFSNNNLTAKTVRRIVPAGDVVYLLGDFGIVVYDVAARESRASYRRFAANDQNVGVKDLILTGDSIFALLTNNRLVAANRNRNLADQTSWIDQSLSGPLQNATGNRVFGHLLSFAWGRTLIEQDSLLWVHRGGGWQRIAGLPTTRPFFGVSGVGNELLRENGTTLWSYDGQSLRSDPNRPKVSNQQVRSADGRYTGHASGSNVLTAVPTGGGAEINLAPFYPRHSRAQHLALGNGQMYISPCGTDGIFGPCFDNSPLYHLDLRTKAWTEIPRGGDLNLSYPFWNLGFSVYDEATDIAYISSYENGILRFRNANYLGAWDASNSCVDGVLADPATGRPTNIRVSALALDSRGTLWTGGWKTRQPYTRITPTECETYDNPTPDADRVMALMIDQFDRLWFGTENDGVVIWDGPGSFRLLKEGAGAGDLPANNVTSLVQDQNGQVWIGTDNGVAVFFDVANALEPGLDASCPLVNGFCLLRNTAIQDIVVDGANRKWIATKNSGLFLVDPTGTQVLQRFEYRSSPLISNVITDLAWDPITGELFVATDVGLVSYKTDVTAPRKDLKSLFVYPNPVFTNYTGPVTIDGGIEGTVLKITTPTGQLVRELNSTGGRTLWDGTDAFGRRVNPGVYLVLAGSRDGQIAGHTQFVVVNPE
jgi:hypothetical protein